MGRPKKKTLEEQARELGMEYGKEGKFHYLKHPRFITELHNEREVEVFLAGYARCYEQLKEEQWRSEDLRNAVRQAIGLFELKGVTNGMRRKEGVQKP